MKIPKETTNGCRKLYEKVFQTIQQPSSNIHSKQKIMPKNTTKSSVKNAYTKTTKLTIVENKKDVRKKKKKNKFKDRNKFPKQGCLLYKNPFHNILYHSLLLSHTYINM